MLGHHNIIILYYRQTSIVARKVRVMQSLQLYSTRDRVDLYHLARGLTNIWTVYLFFFIYMYKRAMKLFNELRATVESSRKPLKRFSAELVHNACLVG